MPIGVVVLAAVVMVGLRLWWIRRVPFVFDEPIFLDAARRQLESGHWLSASPIEGTQGIRYGPSVFWFYSGLQWLFGYGPQVAVVAMCVLTTVTQTWLVAGLARVVGGGRRTFFVLLAFVASSPYLYFWSRLAWDQTVLVCAAASVAVLCTARELRWRHGLALGFLLGVAVSSHLMVLPFVGAVIVVLLWEMRRVASEAVRVVGTLVAALVCVNLPYLRYLLTNPTHPASPGLRLGGYAETLWQTPSIVSAVRIEYFFDDEWSHFVSSSGVLRGALWLRVLAGVVCSVVAVVGLASAWSSSDVRRRRVARCATLTWAGSAAFFVLQGVGAEPHYQFAIWWVVPAGMALAIDRLRALSWWRAPSLATMGAITMVNLVVLGSWISYTSDRSGTRGIHFGSTLDAQSELVDELCGLAHPVLVQNRTQVFQRSLEYLMSVDPDCATSDVRFCTVDCSVSSPDRLRLSIVYGPRGSAALELASVGPVVSGPP